MTAPSRQQFRDALGLAARSDMGDEYFVGQGRDELVAAQRRFLGNALGLLGERGEEQ